MEIERFSTTRQKDDGLKSRREVGPARSTPQRKSLFEGGVRFIFTFMQWMLLPATVILTTVPVYAQHGHGHGHGERPQVMETMVVTADRIDAYVKSHPGQVEVLGKADIDRRNMLSVDEALRSMPGVDVKESSGIGVRISIRGSGTSGGVLVLINGRPVNSTQYGSTDLSTIPIDIVQSITVFKPPVPVWLGPGSSDGAIMIATGDPADKKDEKRCWTKTRVAGGSYGRVEGSLSHRVKTESGTIVATASGSHRDGKRTNSDRDNGALSLHWDRDLSEVKRIEIDGRYHLSEHGSAGPVDNPTPDARQAYQKASLESRLKGMVDAAWDYTLNLYGDLVDLEDRSQAGFTSTLDSVKVGLKGETDWADEDLVWDLRLSGIVAYDDVDHTLSGEHDRTTAGIGAQVDRRWDAVTGTVGLRGDYTSDFDVSPGFSTGVSYQPSDRWTAKLNAGYQVKIPTFGQLYQPSHGSIDQVRGNPDLDEERIWSYDAGIEYRRSKTQLFQLALFRSDTRDPIVYERGADLIYRPVNADRSWRHGIEATVKLGSETGLMVDLNTILQDSEIAESGNELPYTPRVKLKVTVQYTWTDHGTRMEATARYCSEQYSEVENRDVQRMDDYVTVDLKAVQPFTLKTVSAEWFLTVENLFDAEYETHHGYPDDGIRFVSGLNLTF